MSRAGSIPHGADARARLWRVSVRRAIPLDRARVIAILNVTPDSFYDAGRLGSPEDASLAAERALASGADALDVGGESTRPGATRVSATEQIRRVVPAIRAIRARAHGADVPIIVDTTLAEVAERALDAGADAVNDVSAGREDPRMLELVGERGAGLILMHRLRAPGEDSYSDAYARAPAYDDVVEEVGGFLEARAREAVRAGVREDAIVLDPGLGFGKSVEQNLALIRGTPRLRRAGYPVLSALSRKSFVGRVGLERDSTPGERLAPTLALSVVHLLKGASLFRVHDALEHVRALRAAEEAAGRGGGEDAPG